MHVGEQPYVVAPAGPVELSARPLTLEAVAGMLGQLLPAGSRRALDELGAVEHELPTSSAADGERFTVVAARGGDDIWIEIRRHRGMHVDVPLELPARPGAEPTTTPSTEPLAVAAAPSMEVEVPLDLADSFDLPDGQPETVAVPAVVAALAPPAPRASDARRSHCSSDRPASCPASRARRGPGDRGRDAGTGPPVPCARAVCRYPVGPLGRNRCSFCTTRHD